MISSAIREFEMHTFIPVMTEVKKQLRENDEKTDDLYRLVAQLKGVVWAVGVMLAAPGFIAAALEIWKESHK